MSSSLLTSISSFNIMVIVLCANAHMPIINVLLSCCVMLLCGISGAALRLLLANDALILDLDGLWLKVELRDQLWMSSNEGFGPTQ